MVHESVLTFAADHPAFPGHFPGTPIVPGVLLLDAAVHAAQAAGVMVIGVASAKFLSPVGPDQMLGLSLQATAGRLRFDVTTGGRNAATGQLVKGGPA